MKTSFRDEGRRSPRSMEYLRRSRPRAALGDDPLKRRVARKAPAISATQRSTVIPIASRCARFTPEVQSSAAPRGSLCRRLTAWIIRLPALTEPLPRRFSETVSDSSRSFSQDFWVPPPIFPDAPAIDKRPCPAFFVGFGLSASAGVVVADRRIDP